MLSLQGIINRETMNFVNSQLENGNVGPLNMKEVITFEKYVQQDIREGDPSRYQIMFVRNENSIGPKYMFWKYNSECDRDKDYEDLVAHYSTTLGNN